MNIIIVGAGQVGESIAEILSREENDVTLIDNSSKVLSGMSERMDIRLQVGEDQLDQKRREKHQTWEIWGRDVTSRVNFCTTHYMSLDI